MHPTGSHSMSSAVSTWRGSPAGQEHSSGGGSPDLTCTPCPEIKKTGTPPPLQAHEQRPDCSVHLSAPGVLIQDPVRGAVLPQTCLMWTFKAWAERSVPRSGTGRQGGGVAGPHLTPGGKAGWWEVAHTRRGENLKSGSGRQSRQGTCRPALEKASNQVVSAQAGAWPWRQGEGLPGGS